MSDQPSSPVISDVPDAPASVVPAVTAFPSAAPAAAPSLFDEDGITITASRIVVYGTSFPFKDVIGARLFIDQRHKAIAVSILVIGVLVCLYGILISSSPSIALGVMLAVVSYLTWRFQTMRHRVFLVRASGDTEVLAVSNLPMARRVEQALDAVLAANRSVVADRATLHTT